MKAPEGMPKGDPKWTFWGTIIIAVWVVVLLIIPYNSDSLPINILSIIWRYVPVVAIGLFVLFIIVGVVLYQIKKHSPTFYENMPAWIKKLC